MVDARLPAEWLGSIRIDNLSDRAFRILAGALMWCNAQGTDGSIPERYTRYLHPDGDDQAAFDEIEGAGLWIRVDDGYVMAGWSTTLRQSTAAQVEEYREASRLRQKRYRDRQRLERSDRPATTAAKSTSTGELTRNATHDLTANVGSGSNRNTRRQSAHAPRNVTRDADSPFCGKHPAGTTEPCRACARARVALAARENTITGLGWDCSLDGH